MSAEKRAWKGMMSRCYNPNNAEYLRYGGANPPIIVEFDSFEQFLAEIGPRPGPEYSLDRYPNNAGNYAPGNVRWATASQQSRNLKSNTYITFNGITKLLVEWAEETGIPACTIKMRLKHGWSVDRVLTEPVHIENIHKTIKHGALINGKETPEYTSWNKMHGRCYNPNNPAYSKYGGAGIIVAQEWHSFEKFLKDIGPRPGPKHSLDRYPNNAGNYGPGNTRWATKKEQSRNLKTNHLYELDGIIRTITEWAELCGVSVPTISIRLSRGWDLRRALTTGRLPSNPKRGPTSEAVKSKISIALSATLRAKSQLYEVDGVAKTIFEWAEFCGVTVGTIKNRIKRGWDLCKALTTPNPMSTLPVRN